MEIYAELGDGGRAALVAEADLAAIGMRFYRIPTQAPNLESRESGIFHTSLIVKGGALPTADSKVSSPCFLSVSLNINSNMDRKKAS